MKCLSTEVVRRKINEKRPVIFCIKPFISMSFQKDDDQIQ